MSRSRIDRVCARFARMEGGDQYDDPASVRRLGTAYVVVGLALLAVPGWLLARPGPAYYAVVTYLGVAATAAVPLATIAMGIRMLTAPRSVALAVRSG